MLSLSSSSGSSSHPKPPVLSSSESCSRYPRRRAPLALNTERGGGAASESSGPASSRSSIESRDHCSARRARSARCCLAASTTTAESSREYGSSSPSPSGSSIASPSSSASTCSRPPHHSTRRRARRARRARTGSAPSAPQRRAPWRESPPPPPPARRSPPPASLPQRPPAPQPGQRAQHAGRGARTVALEESEELLTALLPPLVRPRRRRLPPPRLRPRPAHAPNRPLRGLRARAGRAVSRRRRGARLQRVRRLRRQQLLRVWGKAPPRRPPCTPTRAQRAAGATLCAHADRGGAGCMRGGGVVAGGARRGGAPLPGVRGVRGVLAREGESPVAPRARPRREEGVAARDEDPAPPPERGDARTASRNAARRADGVSGSLGAGVVEPPRARSAMMLSTSSGREAAVPLPPEATEGDASAAATRASSHELAGPPRAFIAAIAASCRARAARSTASSSSSLSLTPTPRVERSELLSPASSRLDVHASLRGDERADAADSAGATLPALSIPSAGSVPALLPLRRPAPRRRSGPIANFSCSGGLNSPLALARGERVLSLGDQYARPSLTAGTYPSECTRSAGRGATVVKATSNVPSHTSFPVRRRRQLVAPIPARAKA